MTPLTDAERRDQAVAHLRKTTARYTAKLENTPTSEWGKAFAFLNQIGVDPPTPGLVFPRDPLTLYASGGGLNPVVTATDIRCELTGPGTSRGHWPIALQIGGAFVIRGTIHYTDGLRGTDIRIENFNVLSEEDADFWPGMYRLELDRWKDGSWHVVRNRHKSTLGAENVSILGPYDIPSGSLVELRGILSPDPAVAHTSLIVNGSVLGTTLLPNWSGPEVTQADRARFGIVEGSESAACTVTVSGMTFA